MRFFKLFLVTLFFLSLTFSWRFFCVYAEPSVFLSSQSGTVSVTQNMMTIDPGQNNILFSNGSVGIGITPNSLLDVAGTVSTNEAVLMSQFSGDSASFSGTVTANYFYGDGSGLTNISSQSGGSYFFVGTFANSSFSASSPTLNPTLTTSNGIVLSGTRIQLPANRRFFGRASLLVGSAISSEYADVTFYKVSGSATLHSNLARVSGETSTGTRTQNVPTFFIDTTDTTLIECIWDDGSGTLEVVDLFSQCLIWEI